MRACPLLKVLVCLVNIAVAQPSFTPRDMGPAINTTFHELNPVLSSDGNTLFFTRSNHPENTFGDKDSQDIWVSQRPNGIWSPAVRLTQLNIGRYNAVLGVLENGALLLHGIFNRKGNLWENRGLSISFKEGGSWGTPVALDIRKLSKRNDGLKSSASMSADESYLVLSFSTAYNSRKTDLFLSRKRNNKWLKPARIKKLSTRFNEETPFLSADNNTMYFASDREDKGKFDIYKSTRNVSSSKAWKKPIRVNDSINTSAWEAYFKTNVKGSIGYFSSTRHGSADIFQVKLFEENPFVVVSGKIINSKSKRLLTHKRVTILVDGDPADDVTFNTDSATYRIKLPLGKTYVVSLQMPDYTGRPDTVDVANVREFTTLEKNLHAAPLPYVLIKGRMVIKDTDKIIPALAQPKIQLDNATVDSAIVNVHQGTYELKVNYGRRHMLKVNAMGFDSSPKHIDLEAVDEYKVMIVDLEVEAEKEALITGHMLDKETGKPIRIANAPRVSVAGPEEVYATVDSTSGYELKLPIGSSYTIQATASGYFPSIQNFDVTKNNSDVVIIKDIVMAPVKLGQPIRLKDVVFETGKSTLLKESFAELDSLAELLLNMRRLKIEVHGHTDNVGSAHINQKLSQARADAVASYLNSKGITDERIVSRGYGMTKPVASNQTKKGRYQNRRVEVMVLEID